MARVSLEGVSKRYPDGNLAVRDLTLEVQDQELLVVVGPSGCGKSTTLRLIAGLEVPTDGIIRIGHRVVNGLTCKQRNVAMVFQHSPLYAHWTVRQNLVFGWQLRHWKLWKLICPGWFSLTGRDAELDKRLADVSNRWELAHLLDRQSTELSGGERQRVAFGRAMLFPCDALLLDEPLGNLDARLKNELRRRFESRHQHQPFTTIYVTHDQSEGMAIADRLAVMRSGRIEQVGTPEDIYNRPLNQFVAQFVGEPSINLLHGVLEKGNQGWAVRVGQHTIAIGEGRRIRDEAALGRRVVLGVRPQYVSVRSRPHGSGVRAKPAPSGLESTMRGKFGKREWVGGSPYVEVSLDFTTGAQESGNLASGNLATQDSEIQASEIQASETQNLETRVDQSIICRVDESESVRTGDWVHVDVLCSRVLVFDSTTGCSLL